MQGRCSSTVCRYARVYCVLEIWPIVVHVPFSTPVWRRKAPGTCPSATSCVVSFDCFQKTPPTGQWRYTAALLTRQGMGMEVPHHTGGGGALLATVVGEGHSSLQWWGGTLLATVVGEGHSSLQWWGRGTPHYSGGGGALLTTVVGEGHSSLQWWGRGTPHYSGGGGARVHAHTLLHSSALAWSLLRSLLPLSHCSGIPTLTHFLHFGYLTRSAKEESHSVSWVFPVHGPASSSLCPAGNFQSTLKQTVACQRIPFDFSSSFVSAYFGPKRTLELDYFAFTQLLQVRASLGRAGGGAV